MNLFFCKDALHRFGQTSLKRRVYKTMYDFYLKLTAQAFANSIVSLFKLFADYFGIGDKLFRGF